MKTKRTNLWVETAWAIGATIPVVGFGLWRGLPLDTALWVGFPVWVYVWLRALRQAGKVS